MGNGRGPQTRRDCWATRSKVLTFRVAGPYTKLYIIFRFWEQLMTRRSSYHHICLVGEDGMVLYAKIFQPMSESIVLEGKNLKRTSRIRLRDNGLGRGTF